MRINDPGDRILLLNTTLASTNRLRIAKLAIPTQQTLCKGKKATIPAYSLKAIVKRLGSKGLILRIDCGV
jgi:hypothetical protein